MVTLPSKTAVHSLPASSRLPMVSLHVQKESQTLAARRRQCGGQLWCSPWRDTSEKQALEHGDTDAVHSLLASSRLPMVSLHSSSRLRIGCWQRLLSPSGPVWSSAEPGRNLRAAMLAALLCR